MKEIALNIDLTAMVVFLLLLGAEKVDLFDDDAHLFAGIALILSAVVMAISSIFYIWL